jgi:hypothetical protein
VTAVYDRYRYDKEKRAPLEKWVAVLTEVLGIKPAPTAAPARPVARADVYEFRRQRAAAPAGLVTGRPAEWPFERTTSARQVGSSARCGAPAAKQRRNGNGSQRHERDRSSQV